MSGTTVGIIYPGHAAEDEYPAAARLLGVDLPVAHVHGTDLHAVAELVDLGNPERLAEGAAALAAHRPQAVMWACTSGSFVLGPDGARAQTEALSRAAGVPAASTSQSFVAALAALGVARVAVAASYPRDIADLFAAYLTAAGVEVVATSSAGIATGALVGELDPDQVRRLVTTHDHAAAEAVLVPDTAMRTLDLVAELETELGKPVLTANQVTVWHGLRLAGAGPVAPRLGTLFSTRRQDHADQ